MFFEAVNKEIQKVEWKRKLNKTINNLQKLKIAKNFRDYCESKMLQVLEEEIRC